MSSGTTLRLARVVSETRAEGPGLRWAVWVQGCSIGCEGCCNPHTWDARGGDVVEVDDLIHRMLTAPVEGITLLGGEPFEQAPGLAELAEAAQRHGLGVMTFTGYRYEVLQRGSKPGWRSLLAATDLLVDGPFLHDRVDTSRPWVGSTNQRTLHLSDRYRDTTSEGQDKVEIRLRRDGSIVANGWPERAVLDVLEELAGEL